MGKLLHYPVRLLFFAHTINVLLVTWLYWNINDYNTAAQVSSTKISTFKLLNELLKGIADTLQQWLLFLCLVAVLYVLFLIALKMVCRIRIKELLLFALITAHGMFIILLILSATITGHIANYLFVFLLLLINFLLLKFSDYWNYTADGLPD
ncbi:hypothetical protein IQ13_2106 [Lacibacter cauensis]|uniref:Uncharacterized protein n=1 Tax=Lacibacter cauensis TaxID=510947 RepID=A0A562SJ25_9BACT|nr:hypothetical protein IQ13_2106 [Lacibacter cauensis]